VAVQEIAHCWLRLKHGSPQVGENQCEVSRKSGTAGLLPPLPREMASYPEAALRRVSNLAGRDGWSVREAARCLRAEHRLLQPDENRCEASGTGGRVGPSRPLPREMASYLEAALHWVSNQAGKGEWSVQGTARCVRAERRWRRMDENRCEALGKSETDGLVPVHPAVRQSFALGV
jgi:hypothetical protein